MLIATTNDAAGYDNQEVVGEVFGLTVRSRNIGSQIGASLKSLVGGELAGMTKMLAQGREQAIERLVAEAKAMGANAVLAMRFDTSESGRRGPRSARMGRGPGQEGMTPRDLSGGEGLLEVGDEVVRRLDPNRQAHEPGRRKGPVAVAACVIRNGCSIRHSTPPRIRRAYRRSCARPSRPPPPPTRAERHHAAEIAHLALGHGVPRMRGDPG